MFGCMIFANVALCEAKHAQMAMAAQWKIAHPHCPGCGADTREQPDMKCEYCGRDWIKA